MQVTGVLDRSMYVDLSTMEVVGQIAYETMALCAVVKSMKKDEPVDPFLLTSWKSCDEETKRVYRAVGNQILKTVCQASGLTFKEVEALESPPWAQLFQLLKTQPNTSEANVIFNALNSGPLPEA
jgi:hypothetical protein